jgi:hypothetical protein
MVMRLFVDAHSLLHGISVSEAHEELNGKRPTSPGTLTS